MAHLLRNLAPIFLMCDPRDLQAVAQVRSPFTARPTLFLYENQPGGVGMARRLFEMHARLMDAALEAVDALRLPGGLPGMRRALGWRARHEQAGGASHARPPRRCTPSHAGGAAPGR